MEKKRSGEGVRGDERREEGRGKGVPLQPFAVGEHYHLEESPSLWKTLIRGIHSPLSRTLSWCCLWRRERLCSCG